MATFRRSSRSVSYDVLQIAAIAVALLLVAAPAIAQVTGKVIGTVVDSDTGQPLVGAPVVVEGTNLGNVTSEDGYYFINNVPVGVHAFLAQYLGYQAASLEQRVLAGQTMTVDFALETEALEADAILAVIEREPLVIRDNMISKSRFTGEVARQLPVNDVESVIELGAGIYQDRANCGIHGAANTGFERTGCGFVIRGGRVSESATYVDGALVTDFNYQTTITKTSTYAIEELDVITGGFNAEFGHAQSGIINIVTREGGREFHGNVRFTTDAPEVEQSYGYNNLQVSLGGPIIPDRLTAHGSFEATGAEDFFPASAGFNPATGDQNDNSGSTEELLPGNRGDRTLGQGKLTAFLPFDSKLTSTYLYSREQFESHQPSRSLSQFTSSTATRTKTYDFILGYDQQIFQAGERNLNLQVRGNYHLSKFFQGTPLSTEMSDVLEDHYGPGVCGSACIVDEDAFEEDFLNYRVGDVRFFFEDSLIGTTFGFPRLDSSLPDPVFGQRELVITTGLYDFFRRQNERRYGIRVDLDSQVNRAHRAKLGLEWNWINLFQMSGFFGTHGAADAYDVDPRVAAAYVQDRLDIGDLVIDVGLRWDHWDPNTIFPRFPGFVDCSIAFLEGAFCREAEVREAEANNEWSPRLGVAHPITDASQVRLSYGRFHQLPQLLHLFSSFLQDERDGIPGIVPAYGNPNLDYIETTAFEAGVTHQISENMVLDVVGYNRDRRGAVRLDRFESRALGPNVPESQIFVNGDNGNVKGVDFTLTRRFADYWSTNIAWSLQWARGTTSSPLDWARGFGSLFAPEEDTGVIPPPTRLQPEDFDRLHNINWQFTLQLPEDFRQGTAWGTVLQNFGVFLTYNAQSGTPYTRVDLDTGHAEEDFNESRQPWIHSGDIRVTKGFFVSALNLEVFALIENVLNTRNVIIVNPITGLPNIGGTEFTDSRNPQIPENFLNDEVLRGFPLALTDVKEEWRDEFSRQDLDGDGVVTLEESQETAFRGYIARSNSPLNYGAPRQIRLGAEIRF